MQILKIVLVCTLYAVLNTTGAAIIKNELKTMSLNSVKDYVIFLFNFRVIGAFSVILLSALMMFKAFSLGKFSLISPIATGINFFITVMIGFFIFKETLTALHFAGLSLIFIGIIIIGFAEKSI